MPYSNPVVRAEYLREWRQKNPDKIVGYNRSRDPEARRAYEHEYWNRPENRQRRNEQLRRSGAKYQRTQRGRELNAMTGRLRRGGKTPESREYIEIIAGDPCAYCGGSMEHVDHIRPICDGGTNEWTNLAPACARCNQSKKEKSLLEFLLARAA